MSYLVTAPEKILSISREFKAENNHTSLLLSTFRLKDNINQDKIKEKHYLLNNSECHIPKILHAK